MDENSLTAVYYGLYGIAFVASMLAFLMTNMQKLRFLIVLSSMAYAIYYYFFPAEPLWLDVGSELALVVINGFMLIYLTWGNSRIRFNQREQFLYEHEFADLTRIEFNRLLKISEWHLEAAGFVYTIEGEPLEDIYYLASGHAEARLPDGNTVVIPQGNVIGEVSYRLQCPASATVTGAESCMCLRWNQDELRALCNSYINIKYAVDNVLSSHMARKLSDSTEERPDRDTPIVEPG
ncbi:MAG: cyclic nucleotide-binding domain-containing protein [Xanthomonadales bacterium]|nr:cyclic nucleotide-binding domain-containing protein [Xanthomonadales bacterium]